MPIPVSDLLARVSKTLYDETNVIYSSDELLDHLNEAIAGIVQLDPKAYMLDTSFELVAGSKQTVPGDTVALVAVRYNTSADGSAQGRTITATSLDALDAARPDWHTGPPSHTIRHYAVDPRDPKRFYVWPPAFAGDFVQISHYAVPANVGLSDNIPLPDLYNEALYLFVVYHCLLRVDDKANFEKANYFRNMFLQALGADAKTIRTVQPRKPESAPTEDHG